MLTGYFPNTAVREITIPPPCGTSSPPQECVYASDDSGGNDDNSAESSNDDDINEFLWEGKIGAKVKSTSRFREPYEQKDIKSVHVKLIDFNTAVTAVEPQYLIWDSEGTRLFTPPECFGSARTDGIEGKPRDVWSVGCLLYCLVFGRPPFWAETPLGALIEISRCELVIPDYVSVSANLVDLLRAILKKDPLERITIEGIYEHPWMKGVE
eukprot:Selendium_serpulae@DN6324_c0_g2_i1.p1